MIQYKWRIESIDETAGTMVVSYTSLDDPTKTVSYNMSRPLAGASVDDHIAQFAPVSAWRDAPHFEPLEHGQEGVGTIASSENQAPTETPNVAGSWSDEYIRAMIYQVMEEMREAEV
jgi:hypothetical protein